MMSLIPQTPSEWTLCPVCPTLRMMNELFVVRCRQTHMYTVLSEILDFIARRDQVESPALLTRDFHVWPDYHGNRSPLADPTTCGMVMTVLYRLYCNVIEIPTDWKFHTTNF